jgi:hypothetical protein
MTIRIGNEYLDFDQNVEVLKRAKTIDTIDSAGDFSYAFTLPDTAKNRKHIKLGVNRSDKNIYRNIPCIVENQGNQVYFGFIRAERSVEEGIECSFFSGNNNWFNAIEGLKIYELDLSQFALPIVNISPSPIIPASWTATEGITFPFLDRGRLKNWSSRNLDTEDFFPMVYMKSVLPAIFQQNGFKVTGDLFNDSLYNNIVVGSGNRVAAPSSEGIASRNSFVGKGSQSINTVPQIVTFTNESYPFFDGGNFTANRYSADLDLDINVDIDLSLDASETYVLELYKNGVQAYVIEGTGDEISTSFNDNNAIGLEPGDYLEVFMSIDTGTVNITEGSVRFTVIRLNKIYPQFLFGNMSQSEFVYNVFTMFNIIADYDQFTKTVTLNLFKDISNKPEQDLSEYIDSYEVDYTEVIGELSKRNLFVYEEGEDEDQITYNEENPIPWGGGSIDPENDFINGESERTVSFAAPYSYYNEKFKANLESTGTHKFSDAGDPIEIIDVTLSGSSALFQTSEPHNFSQLDYVWITDVAVGSNSIGYYIGIGRIATVPNPDLFTVQNLDFQAVGAGVITGHVKKMTLTITDTDKVFIGINIPNMLVSDFSGLSSIEYGSARTRMAYMYFFKSNINKPIDNMRESLSFGATPKSGYNQITLLDKYYDVTRRYLNDPVKVISQMHIPFKVFNALDFSRPVRLRTVDFDIKSFLSNIEGWVDSDVACKTENIKL